MLYVSFCYWSQILIFIHDFYFIHWFLFIFIHIYSLFLFMIIYRFFFMMTPCICRSFLLLMVMVRKITFSILVGIDSWWWTEAFSICSDKDYIRRLLYDFGQNLWIKKMTLFFPENFIDELCEIRLVLDTSLWLTFDSIGTA